MVKMMMNRVLRLWLNLVFYFAASFHYKLYEVNKSPDCFPLLHRPAASLKRFTRAENLDRKLHHRPFLGSATVADRG